MENSGKEMTARMIRRILSQSVSRVDSALLGYTRLSEKHNRRFALEMITRTNRRFSFCRDYWKILPELFYQGHFINETYGQGF